MGKSKSGRSPAVIKKDKDDGTTGWGRFWSDKGNQSAGLAALSGIGMGLEAGGDMASTYFQAAKLDSEAQMLDLANQENAYRYGFRIKAIKRKGAKTVSKQASQYVSAGVKLQGSSLDVLADTMKQFNEEAQIANMEEAYSQAQRAGRAESMRVGAEQMRADARKKAKTDVVGGLIQMGLKAYGMG